MIDHMAVMRRQIEEMQEKAMEGRSIAEAMLADVVASVVEESEGGEVFTSSNSGFGAASPDYEPPGSPEYIPPQNDMETEVAETSQEFKCRICGFISEGVIFQLYEHLEEKHGMEGAEEAELEKCCVKVGAEEEEDSAVSKKSEGGLEPRSTVDAGVGQGTRTLPPSIVSSRQSVPPTSLSCCTSRLGALQSDHQANLDEQDVAPLRSHIHCCTSYSCFVCIPGQLLMLASVKVPGRCLLPLSPVGRVDPGLAKAEVGQGRVDPGLVKVPAR